MNYIKHVSIKFAQTHKIYGKKITLKKLLFVAKQNGYIVKTYSASAHMMIMLGVYERAIQSSSVAVIEEKGDVYIFIDDSMPEQKQLFALSHELGHILLKHDPQKQGKRQFEREANLFAHYLLDSDYDIKQLKSAIFYTLGIICFCLSVAFICLANEKSITQEIQQENNTEIVSSESVEAPAPVIIINNINSQNSNNSPKKENNPLPQEQQETWEEDYIETDTTETQDSTFCYFTQHGEVYHLYEDCSYLTRSNEIYCDTIENSLKYRLCSRCASR